jgi:hypothetical protein
MQRHVVTRAPRLPQEVYDHSNVNKLTTSVEFTVVATPTSTMGISDEFHQIWEGKSTGPVTMLVIYSLSPK